MNENIKVVIVEDDKLIRQGLVHLLSSNEAKHNNIIIVGDVGSEEELFSFLRTTPVDVILLDMNLYGIKDAGINILKRVDNQIKVLILSAAVEDANLIIKAISNGAKGFLGKDIDLDELIQNIIKVKNGKKSIVSDSVSNSIIHHKKIQIKTNYENLSKREMEVFKLLAAGYTRQEAASKIFVSDKAIDKYKSGIKKKTDLINPVHYLIWVLKNSEELTSEILELYSNKSN